MFHWICPECGREIAPTVRECPVCDPHAAASEPVPAGVVETPSHALASSEVASLASQQRVSKREDIPTETIVLPPGGLVPQSKKSIAADPPSAAPPMTLPVNTAAAPPPPESKKKSQDSGRYWLKLSREGSLDPLARLEAFARRRSADTPAKPMPIQPPPMPLASEARPAVQPVDHTAVPGSDIEVILPTFGSAELSGNPFEELVSAMGMAEEPSVPPAAPPFSLPNAEPAIPPAFQALLTELVPVENVPDPSALSVPASAGPLDEAEENSPAWAPRVVENGAQPLSAIPWKGPLRKDHLEWLVPEVAGTVEKPANAIEGPGPKMAEWVKYSPLANRPIVPASPPAQIRKGDCHPRVTLPGPVLIKKLVAFHDKELTPVYRERKAPPKRGIPRWMVTALILGTLLGAGFSSFFTFVPSSSPVQAKTTAVPEQPLTEPGDSSLSPETTAATPLTRAIEVTGFRIQVDPKKKSEIHYIAVNHSANKLAGITVFVTLHSMDAKAGEPPLCRFSFIPNLGPLEAKELVSSIERVNRPVAVPDWQNLRAELEIGQ